MKNEEKIKINLRIDGRIYALKIRRDEEAFIRKAAKIADEEINRLKQRHVLERDGDAAMLILIKKIFELLLVENDCEAFSENIRKKTIEILKELDF